MTAWKVSGRLHHSVESSQRAIDCTKSFQMDPRPQRMFPEGAPSTSKVPERAHTAETAPLEDPRSEWCGGAMEVVTGASVSLMSQKTQQQLFPDQTLV